MLTVKILSQRADVSPDTVRHYARIGLLKPDRDPINGYKIFKYDDVKLLRFIRLAKALGFSLDDIGEIITHSKHGHSPCPQVREIIQLRIDENEDKLAAMLLMQQRMKDALKLWGTMPDGKPDGHSICHLIESIVE